jgi:chemotaxis protein methyltransferase CheR
MYQPQQHSPDMSETDFQVIADIAHQEAGLVFTPEKASLVRSRINRRLRKLGIKRFSDYIAFITSQQGEGERKSMINSLTTNISSFFRESHHFDLFANKVFPRLLSNARNGGRVRIWSAGCSSGQEPYSIAMTSIQLPRIYQNWM